MPEVVISILVMGIIIAAISTALSVVVRNAPPTQQRLSEARDMSSIQRFIAADLASAVSVNDDPSHQPVAGQTLAGSNVAVITRRETRAGGQVDATVAYRYEPVGDVWRLVRYETDGTPAGTTRNVLAFDLAAPPAGWQAGDAVGQNARVTSRNVESGSSAVAHDLSVTFPSGREYSVGGTSFPTDQLLTVDPGGFVNDPNSPRSRCGRTITLILDVSGSITDAGAEQLVRDAAKGFVQGFDGTPTRLNVVKFATQAQPVWPGTFGEFSSLLEADRGADAQIAIDTVVFGSGTNWEAPLWSTFRADDASQHAEVPDLVVLVTDGYPNHVRPGAWADTSVAVQSAVDAANYGRNAGARVIGIMVGPASASDAVDNLTSVVGPVAWDQQVPGNAAVADYFISADGTFNDLGHILGTIAVGECGGTVTVQKKIDIGGGQLIPAPGTWSVSSDAAVQSIGGERATATFDYVFDTGTPSKRVEIFEQPIDGYVFDRAECRSTAPSDSLAVASPADGSPGVALTLRPNEAVSCALISRAA